MTLDFDAIEKAVFEGAVKGLNRGARIVSRRAKQRAPVRNIFGHSYRMRAKTRSELTADLNFVTSQPGSHSRQALLRNPGMFKTRWEGPKHVGSPTALDLAMEYLRDYENDNDSPLTSRGAYEVRSGRANFGSGKNTTVGGRLRGEIFAQPAKPTGETAEAWVISPTPYAKYQEFGTRHNRAHPFLRPALEESRGDILTAVREGIARASKKGFGHAKINVVVKL
jgi:HK97 gp10 family phage protein